MAGKFKSVFRPIEEQGFSNWLQGHDREDNTVRIICICLHWNAILKTRADFLIHGRISFELYRVSKIWFVWCFYVMYKQFSVATWVDIVNHKWLDNALFIPPQKLFFLNSHKCKKKLRNKLNRENNQFISCSICSTLH